MKHYLVSVISILTIASLGATTQANAINSTIASNQTSKVSFSLNEMTRHCFYIPYSIKEIVALKDPGIGSRIMSEVEATPIYSIFGLENLTIDFKEVAEKSSYSCLHYLH